MAVMIGCGHIYSVYWYSFLAFSGCLFRHHIYDVVQEAGRQRWLLSAPAYSPKSTVTVTDPAMISGRFDVIVG